MGKYLVFLFFFLFSFDSINSSISPFFKTFHLQIVNRLEFHKKLKIQCESDSFQSYRLPTTYINIGESYQLKFIILPNVMYRCSLWQGPNYKHNVYFKAFIPSQSFIDDTCNGMNPNVCMWIAKERGVYVRHDKFLREYFRYGWDTPTEQREIAPVSALTSES
ncbi:S-protein homolog 26-like [Capsella rubella]|uniref:S-protein homolog 26-like n=1 Tax=Capsella rubella TaxID=81985 RepID=UPI000CD4A8AD|nr:S-protein homolog 26-like [Capsella rubella]